MNAAGFANYFYTIYSIKITLIYLCTILPLPRRREQRTIRAARRQHHTIRAASCIHGE